MTLLLLDASFFEGVIALAKREELLTEVRIPIGPLAEEDLAVRLASMMEGVDELALGIGPGSFTGMRVAAALLLPLAYARALPLTTFSSLEGIAPAGELVATDAKRGRLYLLEGEEVKLIQAEDLPKGRTIYSPHNLKKTYPILENYEIEQAPFQSKLVLPKINRRGVVDPRDVKLSYLQSV